ncbi:hypothetical protein UK23_33270 [Lentzea aerocolonigenes]|uniref:Uncharacterized protein n=1 Tax=Lentzea aerocolonigenes TaxID=68170 RepID=A0A0F0GLM4_LENAE|nr:hypothetical protein [Lentzea aerocolonigenes]KJK43441.1 hypothetical protein UK23_33270 [Lentzea aerocolonigenes]
MNDIVFPIGHYAGRRGDIHVVRVGWRPETLTADEFVVWVLAHGSGRAGKADWTVRDVLALADLPDVVNSLLVRGILAAVPAEPTGAPATLEFTRRHRMGGLLTGLGDTKADPGVHGVGVPGLATVAWLDDWSYELWQWGPLAPALWDVCEVRAKVLTELDQPLEPAQAVGSVLADLRLLLAHGCAYLDVVASSGQADDVTAADH